VTEMHVNVRCPGCGHRVRIRVREMVPGRSKRCPYCSTTFKFSGDDGRKAQRAVDDLERTLKRLSRKITIKL
jgi:CDGSH-type Zn-finger protein